MFEGYCPGRHLDDWHHARKIQAKFIVSSEAPGLDIRDRNVFLAPNKLHGCNVGFNLLIGMFDCFPLGDMSYPFFDVIEDTLYNSIVRAFPIR